MTQIYVDNQGNTAEVTQAFTIASMPCFLFTDHLGIEKVLSEADFFLIYSKPTPKIYDYQALIEVTPGEFDIAAKRYTHEEAEQEIDVPYCLITESKKLRS